MKMIVTVRDTSLDEAARDYARARLNHLEQYFDRITSAEAILSLEGSHTHKTRAEFVVHANRGAILVAHASDVDIKAAIDVAYDEMKREITRHKERLIDRHRARRNGDARKGG
ncbi:MAG TPA: ribosome-associated translation inhibitor RaiA [Planctomycetota bacterium]|nr:ribosome-associated translation inhibitor RaiA [Planctomycetota bacterium]